jgi:hypothetical protein
MEKNAFRTEISLLNLQNHVCNIFQLHKTPLKIKKKKNLTPGIEQLAHGTVAQGTRHKAPTTGATVPLRLANFWSL